MPYSIVSSFEFARFEKFFCVHGHWDTICHAAHLTGDRQLIVDNALPAIECLLRRHSRMRAHFRVKNNRYFLETREYNQESVSSSVFFSLVDSQEPWQNIVERQCNQDPYLNDNTTIFPLFHFLLLYNSSSSDDKHFHLLLFENHCASDGRSGFVLINDFLSLATSTNLNSALEPINNEILPLISDMIRRPFGPLYPLLAFFGKKVFYHDLRELRRPRIPFKLTPIDTTSSVQLPAPKYYTKFLFASTSPDLYINLHKQCQLYETTLNGPLLACLLLAVHHCFPSKNQTRLMPFPVGMAFDMRSRLPRSPLKQSSVGTFIGISDVKLSRALPIQSTRFWSLARKCMENSRDQLKRDGVPLFMNIFSDIVANEQAFRQFTRRLNDGRHSELGWSNIGRYPFSCNYNQGKVQLHGIHAVNNNSVYRTTAVVFGTCAGDGQLDFSLAHEIDNDERAKQFLDLYIRLIEACAKDQVCNKKTTLEDIFKLAQY